MMVERVARAMAARYTADLAMGAVDWEKMARAAILVMRVPTQRMIDAGLLASDAGTGEVLNAWEAMCDEALK